MSPKSGTRFREEGGGDFDLQISGSGYDDASGIHDLTVSFGQNNRSFGLRSARLPTRQVDDGRTSFGTVKTGSGRGERWDTKRREQNSRWESHVKGLES